jgi:hypothetical protein
MNHISPQADLSRLIQEQETDDLDDGFPYEHIGADVSLDRSTMGWITPTAFMVVSMKEILTALVRTYGWYGHWLLREIGKKNLQNPEFVSGLGINMFLRLYDTALAALPESDREAFR